MTRGKQRRLTECGADHRQAWGRTRAISGPEEQHIARLVLATGRMLAAKIIEILGDPKWFTKRAAVRRPVTIATLNPGRAGGLTLPPADLRIWVA